MNLHCWFTSPVYACHCWTRVPSDELPFVACRFGIVFVDFATQRRIPKASARWYSELIASQAGVDVVPAA